MAEERRGNQEEVPKTHKGDMGGRPPLPDEVYPQGRSLDEFGTHGGPGKPPAAERGEKPTPPGLEKTEG